MTEAALNALKNIQDMNDVYVYDTNDSRLDVLRSKFGVHKAHSPDEAVSNADFVVS
jgi:pyrroline-5-carboxylate reductase